MNGVVVVVDAADVVSSWVPPEVAVETGSKVKGEQGGEETGHCFLIDFFATEY